MKTRGVYKRDEGVDGWGADQGGGVGAGVGFGITMKQQPPPAVVVRLMHQLCSKDSPAVPGISLCAYVIRLHGTGTRPGASDPRNAGREDEAIGEGRQAIDSYGTVAQGPLFSTLNVVAPCSLRPPMRRKNNRKRGSSLEA
ncbi:unnamed protein product [Lota lota]